MNKLTKLLPDKIFLKLVFYKNTGYSLSFKNPKTFNAKLQWLKVYNRDPILTMLVDKYEVKEYIKEKIGEEYIIPTVGIWDNADEIDFDRLPEQFVLKCTHDSGSAVFCKNRKEFNIEDAKYRLGQALSNNYFYAGREWPYKNIRPRIVAEKIGNTFVKIDFYCINDKVYFSEITFFPCAGLIPFEPMEWDLKLGGLIKLSDIK